MSDQGTTFRLDLSQEELELLRTALEMLEDTLGREEAEELGEVQSLLRRLNAMEHAA
jgi:hypothetical protein